MKRKFAAAVLAAAMLAMSLAGCSAPSSSQAPGSASATASAPAQDDGRKVLTIAQGGDITTFDMQPRVTKRSMTLHGSSSCATMSHGITATRLRRQM